jgi:hypothetical protein
MSPFFSGAHPLPRAGRSGARGCTTFFYLRFILPIANPKELLRLSEKVSYIPERETRQILQRQTEGALKLLGSGSRWRREKDEEEDQRNENVITTRIL